tara:strand:- start:815 stop:946 length:132 start_codon:yes stop_codon:yes gene_type:complete
MNVNTRASTTQFKLQSGDKENCLLVLKKHMVNDSKKVADVFGF